MIRIIGLTGGIGSGKSTVARYFESHGIPVYYADDAARKIMDTPQIIKLVEEAFGKKVMNGSFVDRKKLAAIVFNDAAQLQKLNGIIHPAVGDDFKIWLKGHAEEKIVIREAAILFESGTFKDCDKVITVTAPLEIRIKRVMHRDGSSREDVISRVDKQWTDEEKIAKSDYVIVNEDLLETEEQVRQILKSLQNL